MNTLFSQWSGKTKPVIGMLHLLPLPGSPLYGGNMGAIREMLVRDAEALEAGGVHALMMENFGDTPFFPRRVPSYVLTHMTAVACEIKRRFANLPLGINVLRNDGLSALSVAHASGADFIRVNVLCGARVTDQGLIQGIAHDLLRERTLLQAAKSIKIFADVDVKHSAPLAPRPIKDEVDDTLERGLADALVVSGAGTGKATSLEKVREVKQAAGQHAPIFIGSGISAHTVSNYLDCADGFIVGTAFKKNGIPTNPVEIDRVKSLIRQLR